MQTILLLYYGIHKSVEFYKISNDDVYGNNYNGNDRYRKKKFLCLKMTQY